MTLSKREMSKGGKATPDRCLGNNILEPSAMRVSQLTPPKPSGIFFFSKKKARKRASRGGIKKTPKKLARKEAELFGERVLVPHRVARHRSAVVPMLERKHQRASL